MTNTEKLEAEEKKRDIILSQGNCCSVCGNEFSFSNIPPISHRIPKYKRYIEKYGKEIIHHRLNLKACCDVCNVKVSLSPASNPVEAKLLIEQIRSDILAK